MPTSLFPHPQAKAVCSWKRGADLKSDSQKALSSISGIAGNDREC